MFVALGVVFLLSIPFVTYFFARRMGRNALLWFCISLIVPGIAVFILFLLPDLSEKNEKPDTTSVE